MEQDALKEIGLTNREIAVYEALLKLGLTTTGPLVKLSGVQNAKIYETLEKLQNKGLVSFIRKESKKHFQATHPKIIKDIFEEKKVAINKRINSLITIKKEEKLSGTYMYEGIKAIKNAFFDFYELIGKNGEYCVFPIGEPLEFDEVKLFWSQVLHKQKRLNITIKTLPNKKLKKVFKEHYQKYNNLIARFTNQEFPTGIFIAEDRVLHIIWGEKPFATLIVAKIYAQKWQMFFDEQWKQAQK